MSNLLTLSETQHGIMTDLWNGADLYGPNNYSQKANIWLDGECRLAAYIVVVQLRKMGLITRKRMPNGNIKYVLTKRGTELNETGDFEIVQTLADMLDRANAHSRLG